MLVKVKGSKRPYVIQFRSLAGNLSSKNFVKGVFFMKFSKSSSVVVFLVVLLTASVVLAESDPVVIPVAKHLKAVPFTAGDINIGGYEGEMYNGEPLAIAQFIFEGDPEYDTPPAFTLTLTDIEPGEYYIAVRVRAGMFLDNLGYIKWYNIELNGDPIEFSSATDLQRTWMSSYSNSTVWGVTRVVIQSKEKYHLSDGDELRFTSALHCSEVDHIFLYKDDIERGPIVLPVDESVDHTKYAVYDVWDDYAY